jgi:uncharacterized protein (DUF934 family)
VVPLIAIDFPSFNDGRGYSTAAVLRSRYQYGGDLRAIGDVLIDQLFFPAPRRIYVVSVAARSRPFQSCREAANLLGCVPGHR